MLSLKLKRFSLTHSPAFLARVVILCSLLIESGLVQAQSQNQNVDFSHPNVTIDLSVISDNGLNIAVKSTKNTLPLTYNKNLLQPGSSIPRSKLHITTNKTKPVVRKIKTKKLAKLPKKNIEKPVKKVVATNVNTTRKSPPTPAKITPSKAPVKTPRLPLKKNTIAKKTPQKLKAPKKPFVAKQVPITGKQIEKTIPPITPVVRPAPKISDTKIKKVTKPPMPEPKSKLALNQQANLPQKNEIQKLDKRHTIAFLVDQTKLPESSKSSLIRLAKTLKGRDNMRLQLMAYAGGQTLSSSQARRVSLSRALAIRSFLIENGVRSTRIDVRALGNKTSEEPLNRVDLNVSER